MLLVWHEYHSGTSCSNQWLWSTIVLFSETYPGVYCFSWSSGFYWPHMQNKHIHNLRTPYGILRLCVFTLRSRYMHVTYAPYEPWLFWLREKPKDPLIQPHAGNKMAQVLGSLVYLWLKWYFSSCSLIHGSQGPLNYTRVRDNWRYLVTVSQEGTSKATERFLS